MMQKKENFERRRSIKKLLDTNKSRTKINAGEGYTNGTYVT